MGLTMVGWHLSTLMQADLQAWLNDVLQSLKERKHFQCLQQPAYPARNAGKVQERFNKHALSQREFCPAILDVHAVCGLEEHAGTQQLA